MRWGVVTFPGSNDDHDALYVVEHVLGEDAVPLWHKDRDLQGRRLRRPAGRLLLRRLPALRRAWRASRRSWRASSRFAARRRPGARHLQRLPGPVRGRPAARRADPQPRPAASSATRVHVRVEETDTPFTCRCTRGEVLDACRSSTARAATSPTPATLAGARGQPPGRPALRRRQPAAPPRRPTRTARCNNIAGIVNAQRNVFGLMPHPEHAVREAARRRGRR